MKRKTSLWNTPIINPSEKAKRYAKEAHRRKQEFAQKRADMNDRSSQLRPPSQQVKKTPFSSPQIEAKREDNLPSLRPQEITAEKESIDEQTEEKELGSPSAHESKEEAGTKEDEPKIEYVKRPRVLRRTQRRRQSLSVAVSEEEEDLLRKGAVEAGMTFSAWARMVLFRAMKRKIPYRPPK